MIVCGRGMVNVVGLVFSTLSNWMMELDLWAPTIVKIAYKVNVRGWLNVCGFEGTVEQ